MNRVVVWVADVGSVKAGNFGWARGETTGEVILTGVSIEDFASGMAQDLADYGAVAVGFECPLFILINADPLRLTQARIGERAAYSAGGGSGALVTGLSQTVWVLEQVRKRSDVVIRPTFEPARFIDAQANLLIWEAFVTGAAKGPPAQRSHEQDARTSVTTFIRAWPNLEEHNSVTADNPYSLAGAALLRSGCSRDLALLHQPCVVLTSTVEHVRHHR
jgi:hypothetical protein